MPSVVVIDADKVFLEFVSKKITESISNLSIAECFDNIADATAYLRNFKTDIVITDIFAPSVECENFIDFCKKTHPSLKIILTSSTRDFSYARMAVKCSNVVDFVTKPIDFEYFAATLSKIALTFEPRQEEATVSERTFCKRSEFFSDLIHGHITNIDVARHTLEEIGLNGDVISLPCSLVHFHIDDFMTYIHSTHAQNTETFYDSINTCIPFETESRFCSLSSCSYGNLSWFIIHKKKNSSPDELRDEIFDIIKRLGDKLNLPIYESSHKGWFSLSDMIFSAEAESMSEKKPIASAVTKALSYMRKNYHKDISLAMVAEHVNISPMYFSSYFKKHTGEGFVSKLTNIRIEQAAKLIVTTDMTIRDIKIAVGYGHTGNFYKHFNDRYGMTPNEYKKWYFGN